MFTTTEQYLETEKDRMEFESYVMALACVVPVLQAQIKPLVKNLNSFQRELLRDALMVNDFEAARKRYLEKSGMDTFNVLGKVNFDLESAEVKKAFDKLQVLAKS